MARWEIPILRAKRVTVRIRGARGFAAAGKEPAADVAVGVRHPLTREFLPARYVGEAEGGLNYEISIPVDWAVELKAHSARMKGGSLRLRRRVCGRGCGEALRGFTQKAGGSEGNWWAREDSNFRPPACQAGALTS